MRNIRRLLIVIISIVIVAISAAFSFAEDNSVKLEKNEIVLRPIESEEINILSGEIESIKSSNESIATVWYYEAPTSFTVHAEDTIGSTTIIVKEKGGAEAILKVNVVAPPFRVEPTHIDINCRYSDYYRNSDSYYGVYDYCRPRCAIAIYSNGEDFLNHYDEWITGYGEDYYYAEIVSARSLNPQIVEISGQEIMPLAVGTATIECIGRYGQKDTFTITVHPVFANDPLFPQYVASASNNKITPTITSFSSKSYSMIKNKKKNMKNYLVLRNGDKVKSWKVNKKKIASISKKGILKAKKTGKVKVIAILTSGKKVTCIVTISKKKHKSSGGGTVYWTPSGTVYHKSSDCPTLARSRTIKCGSIKKSKKKRCCKVCG